MKTRRNLYDKMATCSHKDSITSCLAPWPYACHQLKILHVGKFYPPHLGGMETHVSTIAHEQLKYADVEVLAASDAMRLARIWDNGVGITKVPTFGSLASCPLTWGLAREIRAMNPDIVHLHAPNPVGMLAFLRSKSRARLIITHHADTVGRGFLKSLLSPIWKSAMRRSETIIVGSKVFAQSSKELDDYREKVRIIPFGIDLGFLRECAPRPKARPIVLSVGRLVHWKGLEYLIIAMRGIDADLWIIGDGPIRKRLESIAGDNVKFFGSIPQPRLGPYYRAADIFVLPSVGRNESFGLVQLEAMHCGVPVINTSLPTGVPEVSPHSVTGLTVRPGDVRELHSAIRYLLDNPEYRVKLGEAGKKRAAEFTVDRMVKETMDVYGCIQQPLPR